MIRWFHIFGLHIPSYTLMLVFSMVAFFSLFVWANRALMKEDRVTFNRQLFVACLSVGMLGASAFFFNSLFHSIEEKKLVLGGITWLGGVVGAIPCFLILTRLLVPKKRGYEPEMLSAVMPGLALGHAFGRLGCFFGGCCYGAVSSSPLAVVYPANSPAAELYPNADGTGSLPVLPIPLFEAVFEVIMFVAMLCLRKRDKQHALSLYCVGYGIFRFIAEFFRGDSRGSVGGWVTPSQLLSLLLFAFGVLLFLEQKGILFKAFHERRLARREASDALPITRLDRVNDAELLRELHALFEEGIITETEYLAKKQDILDRM